MKRTFLFNLTCITDLVYIVYIRYFGVFSSSLGLRKIFSCSPSGCTFWGQRAWSTRRRWIIRVILWSVAPVVILLVSLLAFPVVTVAIPVATGYEVCENA